jgi:hypothetical protein
MPHQPQHQFDPVAAGAIAAINSSQRATRSMRNTLGAPQLPGMEQAFNMSRNFALQASSFAPGNVLAAPDAPGPFGGGGQGPLPNLQGMFGNLPTPDQVVPGAQGQGQGPLSQLPTPPTPQQAGAGAGMGGQGSGSSDTQSGNGGGRSQTESR